MHHTHNTFHLSVEIVSQVRGLVADNSSSIEHHVVELYDQFYGYFVLNVSTIIT